MAIYRRWSLQVLSPLCWVFQLISSAVGPGNLLLPWFMGHSSGYPQLSILDCYMFLFIFLILCTSLLLLFMPDPALSFFPPHPLSFPGISIPLPPVIILFFLLNKTEASTLWTSFVLNLMCFVNCIMHGCSEFWWEYPFICQYILCVLFGVWVTWLSMIFSSSIHLPANFMSLFFCIYFPLKDIWLFLASGYYKQVFYVSLLYVGASFGNMLSSGMVGSSSRTISSFLRNCHIVLQSGFTSLQSHHQWTSFSLSPHPWQNLLSAD